MADTGVEAHPRANGKTSFLNTVLIVICKNTNIDRQVTGRPEDVVKSRQRISGYAKAACEIVA